MIQASSPLWAALVAAEWSVIAFLVQSSVGEAMSQPLLTNYGLEKAPRGEKALYLSSATAPKVRCARLLRMTSRPTTGCSAHRGPRL